MKKRISVITGGSGGMGKAIAKELGKSTTLILANRNEKNLRSAKLEMDDLGYETYIFPMDVQMEESVEALARFAASLGDVVNVIHTAGVSPTDNNAASIFSINAIGTSNMVKHFFPIMASGGVVINFASMAAYTIEAPDEWYDTYDSWDSEDFHNKLMELTTPFDGNDFFRDGIAYCISKRFVINFTQKNVLRFAEKGCRVLSISPGPYLTPMHQSLIDKQPETAEGQLELIPCGRWGKPYEVAALTKFLCSPSAAFISGVDILTDGGQTANTFVTQIK